MQAITIENNQLQWHTDWPIPTPQPHEALIKVAYAGVNRADIYQRLGSYPPPTGASPLPGLEVSGHIMALGAAVTGYSTHSGETKPIAVGDAVCALLEGGGYAEYATVAATQILPVPSGWSMQQAGALPEALFTCFLALIETAHLQPQETILIHGGASGIGTMAIQLAKQLGAEVIATAGTTQKTAFCRTLGANIAIHYREQDFAEILAPQSVDVILDMVGGDYMQKNLKLLKRGGRLVQLAFQRSAKAELNMAPLLLSNIRWQGITLRNQPLSRKATLARAIMHQCGEWLEQKRLIAHIDSEFTLQDAEKAHAHMEQNLNIGKIVLKVAPL